MDCQLKTTIGPQVTEIWIALPALTVRVAVSQNFGLMPTNFVGTPGSTRTWAAIAISCNMISTFFELPFNFQELVLPRNHQETSQMTDPIGDLGNFVNWDLSNPPTIVALMLSGSPSGLLTSKTDTFAFGVTSYRNRSGSPSCTSRFAAFKV